MDALGQLKNRGEKIDDLGYYAYMHSVCIMRAMEVLGMAFKKALHTATIKINPPGHNISDILHEILTTDH